MPDENLAPSSEATSLDKALTIGTVLMCAAATATAVLFAILVHAIPGAALKALAFVALMLVGSTLVNSRLRGRLIDEGKEDSPWYTALVFLTQFFLALAWAAMIVAIVIMIRMIRG